MARRPVPLRLPEELVAAVDAARGDVSRTRFVERALEAALSAPENGTGGGSPRSPSLPQGAASPRAPERTPPPYGEEAPTPAQLVGWSQGALTLAQARREIEAGTWVNFRKYRGKP